MTIKETILKTIEDNHNEYTTCAEICNCFTYWAKNSKYKYRTPRRMTGSVSGRLYEMWQNKELERQNNVGPLGGCGYRIKK